MVKLTEGYGLESPIERRYPLPIVAQRAPGANDKNFIPGQLWVDIPGNTMYSFIKAPAGVAIWSLLGPGASDVDTINNLSPIAGNINILGGLNISDSNGGNTVTLNLDSTITLAGFIASPLYTSTAASPLNLEAPPGENVIMKLGDAAGVNKLSLTNNLNVEVFSVNSTGTISFSGLTINGAFTQTGGIVSLSEDNSAFAVGIANGTTARAVSIASSAAAHTVSIGSATGAASLDLQAGTGNFTLTGAATTEMTIGQADQTGKITLGSSTAGNVVDINSGITTGAQTTNINAGATGGDSEVNILTGTGTAGQCGVFIGTNPQVVGIDIGHIAPSMARVINIASRDAAQDDTFNLMAGAPSAGNQTVNIMTGTATGGGQVLNLGTGTSIKLINIGGFGSTNTIEGTTSINGGTSLDTTTIGNNISGGPVLIESIAGVQLFGDTFSRFTVQGANDLLLSSASGSVRIEAGEGAADAILLQANSLGSGIDCQAGSAGFDVGSIGPITLNGAVASSFSVTGGAQDLTLSSAGGRVILNGEEATGGAIEIFSTLGGFEVDVALQVNMDSTQSAANAVSITASGGGIVIGAEINDLALSSNLASVSLTSGEAVTDAIALTASDAASGITLTTGTSGVRVIGADMKLVSAAKQLQVTGGAATDFIGQAVLVNGQVTVANTNIAASDRIFVTHSAVNASTAVGILLTTIIPTTSFTIESKKTDLSADETGDQSTIDYFIVREI